jgi:hypothetical protein
VDQFEVLGIPIPKGGPVFLMALAVHVTAGVVCVVSGAVTAGSGKGSARHMLFGRVYLCGLAVLFATVSVMSVIRWTANAPLFVIGCVAFGAGLVGYRNRRHHGDDAVHIAAMGVSYVALLTGFYVDNGKHLPLWNTLPVWSYWVLPSLVGLPVIMRAIQRRRSMTRAAS